ncbi:MAG TPA: VWA domain-containing protein [Pyrinomonadaceae bacterium]|nr:VWA domain-containing protein [Pyrinomonadaceae bacterium]
MRHNIQGLKVAMLVACLSTGLAISLQAQNPIPERERPKLKDFGSSLKHLKWDPSSNAAVETKPTRKKTESDDDVVRVETTLVVSNILVLDKQLRVVPGLTREDFIITEDGRPQEVGAFSLGDDGRIPRSIVLIIDYSGSQLPFIQTSVQAAKTLVDKLNPRDTMAIVTDDVELLVDFTRDKELLKKKLDSLEKKATSASNTQKGKFGRSAQYSALMATLHEAFNDEDQRPVIIFQTDGDEMSFLRNTTVGPGMPPNLPPDLQEQSLKNAKFFQKLYQKNMREFSLNDIYKTAENSRATIYAIIPGTRLIGLKPEQQLARFNANRERTAQVWGIKPDIKKRVDEEFSRYPPEAVKYLVDRSVDIQLALAGVAHVTGGWSDFLEDPAQADSVYEHIFSDISRRYVIGYYPSNKERDGKRRKISIEVRGHPEYVVWGRKSYYAPQPE